MGWRKPFGTANTNSHEVDQPCGFNPRLSSGPLEAFALNFVFRTETALIIKSPFQNALDGVSGRLRLPQMCGMWTKEHRARQSAFERRRYPTDLTDQEWQFIPPLLPAGGASGRRPGIDLRRVLNAIRYLAHVGRGWARSSSDALPILDHS